ncbi:MAG: hypothetical protein ABWZ40_00050 [Caulobacterales bacterium]
MYLASFAASALTLVSIQAASAQDIGHGMSDGIPYEGYASEADVHGAYDPSPRPVRYRDPQPVVKLPATGEFKSPAPQVMKRQFVPTSKPSKDERRKVTGQNLAQSLDDFGDYYDDEMKLRPVDMDGGAGIEYRMFFGATKKQ